MAGDRPRQEQRSEKTTDDGDSGGGGRRKRKEQRHDRILFDLLRSATTKQSVYAQKTRNYEKQARDEYTDINVETQMWEKPRQSTNCRIHYGRGVQQRGYTEATTSCPLHRHTRRLQFRQRPHSFSLSLSVTLCTVTLYTLTTTKVFNHIKCLP